MPTATDTAAPFVTKTGNLTVMRDQILKAFEEFDETKKGKIPDTHKGWFVFHNEQRYHPKWVLKLATGLNLDQFHGSEATKTLNDLGFDLREEETGEDDADDANDANLTFKFERQLQDALRKKGNIEQLEPRLKIIDGGRERKVESGYTDITAEDSRGTTVVIELKIKAGRRAIGQILAYMGDIKLESKLVRGILVAEEFSPQAIAAARIVPNLQLKKYCFKFVFDPASGS